VRRLWRDCTPVGGVASETLGERGTPLGGRPRRAPCAPSADSSRGDALKQAGSPPTHAPRQPAGVDASLSTARAAATRLATAADARWSGQSGHVDMQVEAVVQAAPVDRGSRGRRIAMRRITGRRSCSSRRRARRWVSRRRRRISSSGSTRTSRSVWRTRRIARCSCRCLSQSSGDGCCSVDRRHRRSGCARGRGIASRRGLGR
jgi:hypothetical protein